ncbi:hypothetical protein AAC387_Pa09g1973 [Persea americana]
MAITPAGSLVFFSCSLFMASLFAYSASVQFNDPDWYFWFPLYASASVVNLLGICFILKPRNQIAKFALGVGVFLFLKVVEEGYVCGLAELWSLDLSQRLVREKMGSGLVVISMVLQLKHSSVPNDPTRRKREKFGSYVALGMVLLVAVSFGLSLSFSAL